MNDWKKQLQQISQEEGFGSAGQETQDAKTGRTKQKSDNKNNNNAQKRQSYGTNGNKKYRGDSVNNAGENNYGSYVGAPYNFVPFYDKVYQYPQGLLNAVEDGLITGEITYEVTAQTTIMIGDGDKGSKENPHPEHFFKDAKGQYAIPGSTMRGLIRNNVQVLGLCSYDDDIDDYALMYRKVAGRRNDSLTKEYETILGADQIVTDNGIKQSKVSVLLNVHAGYVANEGGKYVIYQTVVDSIKKEFENMNYYVLSERKIINDYLKYGDAFSYGFSQENGKSILQHEFQKFVHYIDRNNKDHYKGEKNNNYEPYYRPVSYEVAYQKDIIAVGNPGRYKQEGYAVSTGYMNEKKAVYIIPQIDKSKESIPISEEDIRAFRIDLKKKENTLNQFGGKKHFDLPKEGEMRPVFYIQLGKRLYFGFTPRLRLFYDHMVKEGLKQKQKTSSVDYGKALFGYASSEKSYKSKLSFSDAVIQEGFECEAEQKRILAEPKPTSYPDYLKQDKSNSVTYNTDHFELRGAKQYWLHASLVPAETNVKNDKTASAMYPLKKGAKFIGKIRFQNLTEDELGLLLWAVRLNDGSQMNVGKAKAYGYGRISVTITDAKKLNLKDAYRTDGTLCFDPFCKIDIDSAIESYKEKINTYLGKRTIDELPHIRDFFIMKDSEKIPGNERTRYMKIKNNQYRDRKKPLPTIKIVSEDKE